MGPNHIATWRIAALAGIVAFGLAAAMMGPFAALGQAVPPPAPVAAAPAPALPLATARPVATPEPAAAPSLLTPPLGSLALPLAGPAVLAPAPFSLAVPRPSEALRALFRIGYLRPAAESPLDLQWYQNLRRALLRDASFHGAMRQAGFTDVALRPCEGPEDMLQRMDQAEFELAFCPTMVYVQQRAARPDAYLYRVFLQTRRQYWDSHGGEHVRQRGVLFVRRGSPLDLPVKSLTPAAVNRGVASQFLAVSGRYDAAGYFDVRKLLWDDYDRAVPGELLFCGSPQEVVKTVVSGVCNIGACEEGVLREVLNALPSEAAGEGEVRIERNPFVRIIAYTKGVPTDPVVLKRDFDPLSTASPLGTAAAEVLKRVYGNREQGAPVLENSSDRVYDAVVEDARRLQGILW